MREKRFLSMLLLLCMICALFPLRATAANNYIEARSFDELMQALSDTGAAPMGKRAGAERVCVLVEEPVLPDICGADRVLHYAEADEYLLEFSARETAEKAYDTLTQTYGLERCWLNTPEQGAHVMGTMTANQTRTWGESYMKLTSYRGDAKTLAHFSAAQPVVAIIDSGVDPENEALMARSYRSYDFANRRAGISEVQTEGEAHGHGTCVASILDAMLPQNVRFMYLRVFDESHSASRENVLLALRYAVNNGANVINLSLGWEEPNANHAFLDDALRTAYDCGVTIVCAAGNKHIDVQDSYPANSSYTFAVSAINQKLAYEVYSNYGAQVDFCAPGSGIFATTVGGDVISCAGTSFSAPHITAEVAELLILEPAAKPTRIYTLLRSYSKDLGIVGRDNLYGWGIPILPESYSGLYTHEWDGGHVTRVATAARNGERVFTCAVCGETYKAVIPATGGSTSSAFMDVPDEVYYAAPVAWAAVNGVAMGKDASHFAPGEVCTRAQVLTFLWRTAGCPEPKTTVCPFVDVIPDTFFYKAVLWGVENEIAKGMTPSTFAPFATCTRGQVVTFLWRFDHSGAGALTLGAGSAAAMLAAAENPFDDVPEDAYYSTAVIWAVQHGITNGVTERTFEPNTECTRAHVVTFLYRYVNSVGKA